jgi:hypothetical protein
MKMRHLSFFSLATACVFLTGGAALLGGSGCSSNNATGGSGGSTGSGGSGGSGTTLLPENKISDFEDLAAATVVMAGTPSRNGYWYTYNDDNPAGTDATCLQTPPSGPQYMAANNGAMPPAWIPEAQPSAAPSGQTGSSALHVTWHGCSVWGAGIGADLNQPVMDGGTYMGKKVVYNVGAYTGITFWAMATTGSDTALRVKIPMSDETKVDDGGDCVESSTNKCSDDYGYKFSLPANGNWKQITVKFADTTGFVQEGWGAKFTWNPAHVTSIQIQSQDKNEMYDFWIDDMYFIQ